MTSCQMCQCYLHMVIFYNIFCAYSLSVFFVCVHAYVHPPSENLCVCVRVTMINESGKVPVGHDQVQQDLT